MAAPPTTSSLSPSISPTHLHSPDTLASDIDTKQSTLDSRIEESDLDPAAFLKSVRELSEKREREDTERVRKLEEEIEKGRRDRARRREERARSISPEKVDASQPRPLSSRHQSGRIAAPPPASVPDTLSSAMMEGDNVPEFAGFGSVRKSKSSAPLAQTTEPENPAQSASSLARSGTLSWQRRPASRGANSRPQSVALSEGKKESTTPSREEPEKSRDQIAASLGSRDPSWFKQTAERGVGNAAYRRNKDETGSESEGIGRRGLPGMSRDVSEEPARSTSPARSESVKTDFTSRPSSVRDSAFSSAAFSTSRTSTSSKPDLKSLIAADEGQEKASPLSDRASSAADGDNSGLGRTLTMSSSQARLANSQDRPSSPTKGMGGFVSSAMMKRADSQTKRWSAQPGGSLSRQNSLANARSGFAGNQGSHSMPKLEPTPGSRENSNEPATRPTSSSSNRTNLAADQGREEKDVFAKPALPSHSRNKSVASTYSTTAEEGHTSPPSSPSKRWSPTKSSWLESAITKPESPKPVAARNSQPDWMANIAKAKAQRASGDATPKPASEAGSRSASPTKAVFGQGMLKRSESGNVGTPGSFTAKPADLATPRSTSPVKTTFEETSVPTSNSRDVLEQPDSPNAATPSRPPEPAPKPSLSNVTVEQSVVPQPATATTSGPTSTRAYAEEEAAVKSPPRISKPKPDATTKPQIDFRSTLRSRPPPEGKNTEQPEFLAKFGHLKKAETKNYVAPDVLKDNILRGKGDLTKTGGPVKTVRRDELKESLLAKKQQWKQEKEAGVVHERKTSNPPITPQKPEALARRELMGRSGSIKSTGGPEKTRDSTPEALARHKSLRDKPKSDEPMPPVIEQKSEPALQPTEANLDLAQKQSGTPVPASSATATPKQATETSKLASRFNPGLASMLARGPPTSASNSEAPSRSESPALPQRTETPSEPPSDGAALQDVRKGRAKGPKKRKGAANEAQRAQHEGGPVLEPATSPPQASTAGPPGLQSPPVDSTAEETLPKAKPKAPPGSAASIMMASLQKVPSAELEKPVTPLKGASAVSPEASKPTTPAKSPSLSSKASLEGNAMLAKPQVNAPKPALFGARAMQSKPTTPAKSSVSASPAPVADVGAMGSPQTQAPDFKGFGSVKRANANQPSPVVRHVEDNKENVDENSPSVKSAASTWGRQSPPKRSAAPSQIQLPSKKDEEAAMRSAGLLASSPSRPASKDGLGIALEPAKTHAQTPPPSAGAPPKPVKSSRSVSGQLKEASPHEGASGSLERPENAVEQHLYDAFGCVPKSTDRLSIDTASVIASQPHQERIFKTIRKSVQLVSPEGVLRHLPQHQDHTFFDECVYVFSHAYSIANGPKKAEVFVWIGSEASQTAVDQAHNAAKKLAKTEGNACVATVRHGFEPPGFLQALGGILITRRGSQEGASKQYMLCGRQHLGQITFDELDFGITSLCSGFSYLISYPITLQETKLYLWKGSAASPEEISAARLAAMDLSETGEIIEVDDRAEFSSFLKIFGPGTTKASIPPPSELWQAKATVPSRFHTRLFKLQKAEQKTGGGGMFGSFFARRPSWTSAGGSTNASSPALEGAGGIKVEAKEVSPFTQFDFQAESIYLLDAYASLYILVGPVFPSQPQRERDALLTQTVLFAFEYAVLAAGDEDRPVIPKAEVVLAGVPGDVRRLFRFWDEELGFWGTGGLMAGSAGGAARESCVVLRAEAVRGIVCGSDVGV